MVDVFVGKRSEGPEIEEDRMERDSQKFKLAFRNEKGQVTLEYALLMIASAIAGLLLMMAMGQMVNMLYSGVETEIAKPSHH